MRKLLNKKQVAQILNVSIPTIDRLMRNGLLNYRKMGNQPKARVMFAEEDVIKFLNQSKK